MASIKILLRKKSNNEGNFPIVLRLTKDRKVKIITLGLECTSKDWDERNSQLKKSHTNHIQMNTLISKHMLKASKIINKFELDEIDFTLSQFESEFRGLKDKNIAVKDFWDNKISDLVLAGRIGNARAFRDTMKSFFKFYKNHKLLFREITVEVLDNYETFLRSNGGTDGGIGVKMRALRALYNDAIRKGTVDEKYYPFKVFKVSKFKSSGIKKSLTTSEIKKIRGFDERKFPELAESKKLFVFSYFTGGMNFYDIMKLRWENIQNERIVYTRSKTKGNFSIEIVEPVKEILEEYKKVNTATQYVFPILLKEGLTPLQIENRKERKLKKFNKDLKKIAEILGIESKVSSYVARHSFATNLKQIGISTEIISQSMGHQNVAVTTAYLKDFDNDVIDKSIRRLLEEPKSLYA